MGRMPGTPGIQVSWAYNDETTLTSLSVGRIHLCAVPFPFPIPRELEYFENKNCGKKELYSQKSICLLRFWASDLHSNERT